MSATKSQNLFGLHPSALDNFPVPHIDWELDIRPLQRYELSIQDVPALSNKVVSILKSRLREPRRQLLTKPISRVAYQDHPLLTIAQYVRLAKAVDHQLLDDQSGPGVTRADGKHVLDFVDDFQSRMPYAALRKNDQELRKYRIGLLNIYDQWLQSWDVMYAAKMFTVELDFSAYYSSFLDGMCGVLTTRAFRLLSFFQDFDIMLHDLISKIHASKFAHHRFPSPHVILNHGLRSLQASHPAYFTRYHVPVVRQARFTVRSTVRNLD